MAEDNGYRSILPLRLLMSDRLLKETAEVSPQATREKSPGELAQLSLLNAKRDKFRASVGCEAASVKDRSSK
jgi:hypothetical protein